MTIDPNQLYIIRSDKAGVFFGQVVSYSTEEAVLKNARKIYYWEGAHSVEELATRGTQNPGGCKLTCVVPEMVILLPCQIIPCQPAACISLSQIAVWQS